jgi:hypothetical protein
MSETHPTEANGWEFSALDCAVGAADAAMQGTLGIWNAMDPHDRDRWLESRGFDWPRLDIFLRAILPTAKKIVDDEAAVEHRWCGSAAELDRATPS